MDEDEISQDDFLKAFGITEQPTGDQGNDGNQGDQPGTDPNAGANPGAGEQTPPQDGGEGDPKDGEGAEGEGEGKGTNEPNATSKSAQAFAAMRVELSKKDKLLEGVATILGLDPKSKDSIDQLQTKLTEALAKKQGLPVETLERLNRLEEMEQQRNIEQVRNNAFAGFQQVKTTFNLSDDELQQFANDLVAEGKNPFTTQMDLMTEYKLKYFDKLLEQAKSQGAQAEIERAAKAGANASTPPATQGGTAEPDIEKVTNVKELTEWFNHQQSGK